MARVRTPWGPAWLEEGRLLDIRSGDGRAAFWALGGWHGRKAGIPVVLGLARAEGRLSLLEGGERSRRNDSLVAALRIAGAAERKLARAELSFRRLWDAYASGLQEGLSGYRAATPSNLAPWGPAGSAGAGPFSGSIPTFPWLPRGISSSIRSWYVLPNTRHAASPGPGPLSSWPEAGPGPPGLSAPPGGTR